MKRIFTLLILPAIFLAACPAHTQILPPDTTAQIDKIFAQWNRTD